MSDENLTKLLSNQLAASLDMLKIAIDNATEEVWKDGVPPFWQIAFHITNTTDFYFSTFDNNLSSPPDDYKLPKDMRQHVGKSFFDKDPEIIVKKEEIIKFLNSTRERIKNYFDNNIHNQFDDKSGFDWLPMNKLELIIYNIRHIMEHVTMLNQQLKKYDQPVASWKGIGKL